MGSACPHMGCPDYECYEENFRHAWLRKGIIMPTEWFKNDGSGVSINEDDPCMLIVGDYIPDWIRIPVESPLRPGDKLKVLGHEMKRCPKCRIQEVRTLTLEDGFHVAECKPGCGFVFYHIPLSVNTKEQTP